MITLNYIIVKKKMRTPGRHKVFDVLLVSLRKTITFVWFFYGSHEASLHATVEMARLSRDPVMYDCDFFFMSESLFIIKKMSR